MQRRAPFLPMIIAALLIVVSRATAQNLEALGQQQQIVHDDEECMDLLTTVAAHQLDGEKAKAKALEWPSMVGRLYSGTATRLRSPL